MKFVVLVHQPATNCQPASSNYLFQYGLCTTEKQAARFSSQKDAKQAFVRFMTIHPRLTGYCTIATVKK